MLNSCITFPNLFVQQAVIFIFIIYYTRPHPIRDNAVDYLHLFTVGSTKYEMKMTGCCWIIQIDFGFREFRWPLIDRCCTLKCTAKNKRNQILTIFLTVATKTDIIYAEHENMNVIFLWFIFRLLTWFRECLEPAAAATASKKNNTKASFIVF